MRRRFEPTEKPVEGNCPSRPAKGGRSWIEHYAEGVLRPRRTRLGGESLLLRHAIQRSFLRAVQGNTRSAAVPGLLAGKHLPPLLF